VAAANQGAGAAMQDGLRCLAQRIDHEGVGMAAGEAVVALPDAAR
jgi:hypothetical protein